MKWYGLDKRQRRGRRRRMAREWAAMSKADRAAHGRLYRAILGRRVGQ